MGLFWQSSIITLSLYSFNQLESKQIAIKNYITNYTRVLLRSWWEDPFAERSESDETTRSTMPGGNPRSNRIRYHCYQQSHWDLYIDNDWCNILPRDCRDRRKGVTGYRMIEIDIKSCVTMGTSSMQRPRCESILICQGHSKVETKTP